MVVLMHHDDSKKVIDFRKFVGLCQFLHCYYRKLVGFKDISATDEVRLDNSKILQSVGMCRKLKQHMNQRWFHINVVFSILEVILKSRTTRIRKLTIWRIFRTKWTETTCEPAMISFMLFFQYWKWLWISAYNVYWINMILKTIIFLWNINP